MLGIAMLVFLPVFFFASEYAQIALSKTAQQAGLYLLYFFLGFVVANRSPGEITHASLVAIEVTNASTLTDR